MKAFRARACLTVLAFAVIAVVSASSLRGDVDSAAAFPAAESSAHAKHRAQAKSRAGRTSAKGDPNGNAYGHSKGNSGNGNSGNGNGQGNGGNAGAGPGNGNGPGGHDRTKAPRPGEGGAPAAVGTRPDLAWLEQGIASIGDQAQAYRALYLQALSTGDRREAKAAEKAWRTAMHQYFKSLKLWSVASEFLDHRDKFVEAMEVGNDAVAAQAYQAALGAYSAANKLMAEPDPAVLPPVSAPKQGSTVVVAPGAGIVTVDPPGAAGPVPLVSGATIPIGSVVNAELGSVVLASAADAAGATQSATFRGAQFKVSQLPGRPLTELVLTGGNFGSCAARGSAVAAIARRRTVQRLWGHGKGRFRTRGRHGSATVRGTFWLTEESCEGTRVYVKHGVVGVRDFSKGRGVELRSGEHYLARPRERK